MRPVPPAAPEVPPSSGGPSDSRPVILIAEDELQIRRVFRLVLERDGYRVLTACDGDDALAVSRAFPGAIHLLLTDVRMPELEGPELCRRVRQTRPEIMCLLMSGYTPQDLDSEFAFLAKPFRIGQLLSNVQELLEGPLVA
jgi:CheY-like chemotaxis protein